MEHLLLTKMNDLMSSGTPFALVTIIRTVGSTPRKVGAKMIVLENGETIGTIGGGCVERGVVDEAVRAIKEGKPRQISTTLLEEEAGGVGMRCGGNVDVFIDVIIPEKLLVVGGGNVGAAVAKLGRFLGFQVTVIDPLMKEEIDGVEVIREPAQEALPKIKVGRATYAVAATEHKADEDAVELLLRTDATYIGMVGSRRRVLMLLEGLKQKGFGEEALRRLHAPIGLDIGAQTPEEIAVSIMAEIIKVRKNPQATGRSLKELLPLK
ncbi:MAG: XdhC family protein [Candidatus Hadarchaeales archaeon]